MTLLSDRSFSALRICGYALQAERKESNHVNRIKNGPDINCDDRTWDKFTSVSIPSQMRKPNQAGSGVDGSTDSRRCVDESSFCKVFLSRKCLCEKMLFYERQFNAYEKATGKLQYAQPSHASWSKERPTLRQIS